MNKKVLRNILKKKLKKHAINNFFALGLLNCCVKKRLLINFKQFYYNNYKLQQCKIVSLYYPLNYEIDCKPIIRWLLKKNITVVLPKISKKTKILQFYVFDKHVKLNKNYLGINEPKTEISIMPEAIIMPIIGFDTLGYRLGQGGGYYDSTIYKMKYILNMYDIMLIGLAYSWQETQTVYNTCYDVKLDVIVTEKFYRLF